MDTFKLTTLTLLIAFGWIMSEAAAAYPEPHHQTNISGHVEPKRGCAAPKADPHAMSKPVAGEQSGSHVIPLQVMPGRMASHLQGRGPDADTCRLDLDRIKND